MDEHVWLQTQLDQFINKGPCTWRSKLQLLSFAYASDVKGRDFEKLQAFYALCCYYEHSAMRGVAFGVTRAISRTRNPGRSL